MIIDDPWKVSMEVIYAQKPFPKTVTRSLFLAGPTPRGTEPGWREEAIGILQGLGFDGTVFVPEPEDGEWGDFESQVEWEEEALNRADCILFWIPRDLTGERMWDFPMPGLTTNDEWGFWKDSGKVVLGTPPGAEHVRYQQHYAKKYGVPYQTTLKGTIRAALDLIGPGEIRSDGECCIPLGVWRKPEFQAWYGSHRSQGNSLHGARVVWTFGVPPPAFGLGPPKRTFLYAVHADWYIESEDRHKVNEIVILRPDISSVLLYEGERIVLVQEFRTPVRNSEAMVYELPGGSSAKPGEDPLVVAAHEVEEETGLKLDPKRFIKHQERQLVSTLSGHTSTLYSVRLTKEEMDRLAADKSVHGVEGDSERTYIEVVSVADAVARQLVDWSTLGMILAARTTDLPNR